MRTRFSLLAIGAVVLVVPAVALSGSKPKPHQPTKPTTPAVAHTAKPKHTKPAKPARPATHTTPASSHGTSAPQHHVIICHRTGSAKNPYVVINVSYSAWVHGHQTHPALHGRNDILLKDPATPGEKLPVSLCVAPAAASTTSSTQTTTTTASTSTTTATTTTVATSTTPGTTTHPPPIVITSNVPGLPTTTPVNVPVVIVVHTTPNTPVTVSGVGGVLGTAKVISNKRGLARLRITPTKTGVLTVKAGHRTLKRVGVLGAHTSGASLTG